MKKNHVCSRRWHVACNNDYKDREKTEAVLVRDVRARARALSMSLYLGGKKVEKSLHERSRFQVFLFRSRCVVSGNCSGDKSGI